MSFLSSYIEYLREEPEEAKKVHSTLWAGLLTGVFAGIYLYFAYGVKPPLPDLPFDNTETYVRSTNIRTGPLQSETIIKDIQNTDNISVFSSIKDIITIFTSSTVSDDTSNQGVDESVLENDGQVLEHTDEERQGE